MVKPPAPGLTIAASAQRARSASERRGDPMSICADNIQTALRQFKRTDASVAGSNFRSTEKGPIELHRRRRASHQFETAYKALLWDTKECPFDPASIASQDKMV